MATSMSTRCWIELHAHCAPTSIDPVPLSEFELIERYFRGCGAKRADVRLGVGDDAAILDCPAGAELVAAVDSMVDRVHFPHGSAPASVGHRALAVNLSDL